VHAVPRIYGGEIGARARLFDRIDLAAAFWASYLENETVFDADHAAFAPSAPTRRVGVDLEARARLLDWLFADLDLAQATATAVPDHGNGGAVALAPKLYLTGGLTAKHPSGFRAGLRFRYLGPRPAFDEASPEYQYFIAQGPPERVVAQGYLVFDAYAAYRWRFLEGSVSIQNLLNTSWREAQFGNHSCTRAETDDRSNPYYDGPGATLADGSFVDRCGISHATDPAGNTRSGVTDVHFTPGVPFNAQVTFKAYF
jgi:hypothetical protein